MQKEEKGVIWKDGIYFRSTSLFAKNNLFYILWGATYNLDTPYRVKRSYMDAYMLQYITKGEVHFELRGQHFIATENEFVLLDCHEPNHYWAEIPSQVKWFHFNGNAIKPILEYIYKLNGNGHFLSRKAFKIDRYVDKIIMAIKIEDENEIFFSQNIYNILCEAATPPLVSTISSRENIMVINEAIHFMQENFHQQIMITDIAEHVNFSLFYFTRLFKKVMLTSPHLYLLNMRLIYAKKLLCETSDSIEDIAKKSGFQSSSYFIRAFKKATNLTPSKFRSIFLNS
ncbi:AraC family transcriptional regulator [Pelosinus sp. UFO1]|uniref:AraC family transcriptional regulator n=1 Tax=Pelosinus sp. UFO1 TaxID=484770 RepID=UPI0004D11BFE|nr:AraC family transcriptional regulator [Pelosinus sp. UFO1]AIF54150.1 transcriptional regulator, AraC family [Pelosinus sp. UFO1]